MEGVGVHMANMEGYCFALVAIKSPPKIAMKCMSLVTSEEHSLVGNICFLGAGYVGGPTGAVIAAKCPDIRVSIVDLSTERVEAWKSGNLPVKEPFLEEIVAKSLGSNLQFTTDAKTAIEESEIIFISVNTPTKSYGIGAGSASDLTTVHGATQMILDYAQADKIVVVKSTVPVGTCAIIEKKLNGNGNGLKFTVLSNPEFLAEGTAISNLLNPDRVLIGSSEDEEGKNAGLLLASVYRRWVSSQAICMTSLSSAELAKLASNAMLAQRISSINALSAVCEATGANISEVAKAIGMDPRIGSQFLKAGVGFGGSCFQKDVLNLSYLSSQLGLSHVSSYWKQVIEMNDWQKNRFVHLIVSKFFGSIRAKKLAVLGYAFKKDTGDTR